ncbi:MAG: hypothetical protein U1E60_18040 [Reyranellaceae bacterium]
MPLVALACGLAPLPLAAQPAGQVSKDALAAAGRRATLAMIDYGSEYCDGAATVEAWLKALVGEQARSITWTGGKCVLVNDMRPGIDASEWPYCAQATVTLVHPKNKDDEPMIEVYFEKPVQGRPGKAYAFRGIMETREDGPDYIRFRKDFEGVWDERFPPGPDARRCKND